MIQKARQTYVNSAGENKPLSQGDLAKMLNVKPTIVQECESECDGFVDRKLEALTIWSLSRLLRPVCLRPRIKPLRRLLTSCSPRRSTDENMKAKPDPQLLGKMERILKVKLRGAGIGQPLGGPKKK